MTTVAAIEHTGKDGWFIRDWLHPALSLADTLHNIESVLIDDRFMRIFKDFPFIWIVVVSLLVLEGFMVGLEIHCVPEVFRA